MKNIVLILSFIFVFCTGLSSATNILTIDEDIAGPCFIIVQTRHSDGTYTLHGSVYTAEPDCSGTAVITINEQ